MKMDKDTIVYLVQLDFSAAFNIIDHEILLNRLSNRCGINATTRPVSDYTNHMI